MSRREQVIALAPPAPPCFGSRLQWHEFLASAAEHQRDGRVGKGPLMTDATGQLAYNPRFNFCRDCDSVFRRAKQAEGKCVPHWLTLVKSVPTLTEVVEPTKESQP